MFSYITNIGCHFGYVDRVLKRLTSGYEEARLPPDKGEITCKDLCV